MKSVFKDARHKIKLNTEESKTTVEWVKEQEGIRKNLVYVTKSEIALFKTVKFLLQR